jgi:hypothetical protein
VGSVLAVYNWPRNTDRYRRVAHFIDAFFTKSAEFRKPARHPKWKETNLTATLKGWTRFPAAEEWLANNAEKPVAVSDGTSKPGHYNPAEQERLFRQFLEWSKSQQHADKAR